MSGRNDGYETPAGTFELDIHMDKAKNVKKTALRLIRCLFKQKGKLLLIILSILAGSLFEILSPRVLGIAINEIYEGVKNTAANAAPFRVSFETLGTVLLTLLGLYLLQSVCSLIRQMTMTTVSQKLTLSL